MDVEISGSTDKFEMLNFPKLDSIGPGVHIDTVVVTTANAGDGSYQVLLEVTAEDMSSSRPVEKLMISPKAVTIAAGNNMSFAASAFDEHGSRLVIDSCAWCVFGPGTVSETGVFHADTSFGGPFALTVTAFRGDQTLHDTAKSTGAELRKSMEFPPIHRPGGQ